MEAGFWLGIFFVIGCLAVLYVGADMQVPAKKETEGKVMARCSICHRVLQDPDSIKKGIGPDCEKREALKSARRRALEHGLAVTIGTPRSHTTYQPDGKGNYIAPNGETIMAGELEKYLVECHFIHKNRIAPNA